MSSFRHLTIKETHPNNRQLALSQDPAIDIDIVISWVRNDITHINKRRQYFEQGDNNINRFSDHGELQFSLTCLQKYAPWVRNIYITADADQTPDDIKNFPRVIVVSHNEFIPHQYLPTFNSHVIECHLHLIPNLAEHFLYMNDDMFFGRECLPQYFFNAQGYPRYCFFGRVPAAPIRANLSKHARAWINNTTLLNSIFTPRKHRPYPVHHAVPLLKSTFIAAWAFPNVKNALEITACNKFRSVTDIYFIGFLIYWNVYNNQSDVSYMHTLYAEYKLHTRYRDLFNKIILTRPHLCCLNDGLTQARRAVIKRLLHKFYHQYLVTPNTQVRTDRKIRPSQSTRNNIITGAWQSSQRQRKFTRF